MRKYIQAGIDEGASLVCDGVEMPEGQSQGYFVQPTVFANDSIFGLSGAVWGADVEKAKQVARKMRTGQVTINGGDFNLAAPFGGYKQSGNGRELGVEGLHEFVEIKSIQL